MPDLNFSECYLRSSKKRETVAKAADVCGGAGCFMNPGGPRI